MSWVITVLLVWGAITVASAVVLWVLIRWTEGAVKDVEK